ncbi:MAG: 2TM domain-containing protein [Hyphomicrobiales bacterium]|nr:2TM domain-containing protein [Hyphomicrobiales bacterium]
MDDQDERRATAVKRVQAKRLFRNHVAVYLIVNALLAIVWAMSGAGYFWPIWPIAGWGIALALHAWSAYFERPISEDDIRQEMERGD